MRDISADQKRVHKATRKDNAYLEVSPGLTSHRSIPQPVAWCIISCRTCWASILQAHAYNASGLNVSVRCSTWAATLPSGRLLPTSTCLAERSAAQRSGNALHIPHRHNNRHPKLAWAKACPWAGRYVKSGQKYPFGLPALAQGCEGRMQAQDGPVMSGSTSPLSMSSHALSPLSSSPRLSSGVSQPAGSLGSASARMLSAADCRAHAVPSAAICNHSLR